MERVNDQHIYHHNDSDGLRVNISIEKNTKGYNYGVTVVGAKTVEEAMEVMKKAETSLKGEYGAQVPAEKG